MKSLTDCYKLANGVEIPCIGFGTWQTPDGDVCVSSVKAAIAAGYRHIDTAEMYENEDSVGKAIKECGVSREELFVTSKLNNTEHGYEKTMAAFEGTMEKLGLEYLDLFLIHWPNPIAFRDHWKEANAGTWKAFEELYKAGRVRAIGISNFRQHHIEALMETATVPPMVNQMKPRRKRRITAAPETFCWRPTAPSEPARSSRCPRCRNWPGNTDVPSPRSVSAGACKEGICRCPSRLTLLGFRRMPMSSTLSWKRRMFS